MRKDKLLAGLQIPAGIRHLLEDPPLLPIDNREDYFGLFRAFADDVKPQSAIQWMLLQDAVLHEWEIRRLRAAQCYFIEHAFDVWADKFGEDAAWQENRRELRHLSEDEYVMKASITALRRHQLTPNFDNQISAATGIFQSLDVGEKVSRLIASLERRRNNALREIELQRVFSARRSRENPDKFIEAEAPSSLVPAD